MSRVTRAEWYERVNNTWPSPVPRLSADEAVRAGRRLYRFAMRRTFRGKVRVTSGRRYTWIRRGEMVVNPEHAWHGLVHLLSHYCHRRLHPDENPHGGAHARLEIRMIKEAIKRGWLNGNLAAVAAQSAEKARQRAAIKASPASKLARLRAREKRWQTKIKRGESALRTIRRTIKRLNARKSA
jgi:hypothetical protein